MFDRVKESIKEHITSVQFKLAFDKYYREAVRDTTYYTGIVSGLDPIKSSFEFRSFSGKNEISPFKHSLGVLLDLAPIIAYHEAGEEVYGILCDKTGREPSRILGEIVGDFYRHYLNRERPNHIKVINENLSLPYEIARMFCESIREWPMNRKLYLLHDILFGRYKDIESFLIKKEKVLGIQY